MSAKIVLFSLILCAAPALAQESPFKILWERHGAGEDVRADLRRLLGDENAKGVERFNAGYLLAVIEIGRARPKEALALLDEIEVIEANTPQVAVRRAEALLAGDDEKELEKAVRLATKMSGRMSADLRLRHEIVLARFEGLTGKAKAGCERLAKLSRRAKDDWEIHFYRGQLFERLDAPKDAIEAYAATIALLPQSDPCPGIHAHQRWAALSISCESNAYGNQKLLRAANAHYDSFLARAEKNAVSPDLVRNVQSAKQAIEYFLRKD